jgi:hypothetical protein
MLALLRHRPNPATMKLKYLALDLGGIAPGHPPAGQSLEPALFRLRFVIQVPGLPAKDVGS